MHDGSTFSIMHPLTSTKKRNSIRVGQETGAARWPSPPTGATHLVECAAITASGQTCGKPETGGEEIRSGEEILPEVDHDVSRKVGGLSRQALVAALLEAELARTEAEEACAARDQFLAAVSHELRTPLTPVLMAAHLLAQNPEVPVSAREALDMIERNLRIEARLVDDLLDFTRVHCGKLEVSCEAVDVHEVILHALEVTSDDVTRKNQQITVELGANCHEVRGDAIRLQQVFWNLLKNASKFTPRGGSIHVSSREGGGQLIVHVIDSGIGFEPELGSRLFDAFTQGSREVTRRFGGLGLGLAIAKAAVKIHRGTLQAKSEGCGRGATFSVTLPLMTHCSR